METADESTQKRHSWLICFCLAAAVFAAYGRLWHADFIQYDDPHYVTENSHIQHGLNWASIKWAFTSTDAANWHPLTWITHIIDFDFYGLSARGPHMTNVALHAANSILLFLLLQYLTRRKWPSAMVAALFALHPLHVESVAWISERKDVLSALFWILTIWFYSRYTKTPSGEIGRRRANYIGSVVLFALGLMAKPMLVTLPLVLLLLDYWPLGRGAISLFRRVREKWPYFLLAFLDSLTTLLAQAMGKAVISLSLMPLDLRIKNIFVSYVSYLAKLFWPTDLMIAYPMRDRPLWMAAGAAALLLGISLLTLPRSKKAPWLLVGWFWFLITLAPVIGIVQVGLQAMADRYSYIPSIGLFVAVIWTVDAWLAGTHNRIAAAISAAILAACLFSTEKQVSYWQTGRTLTLHAVETNPKNYIALDMLGAGENLRGNTNAALAYLRRAVTLEPDFPISQDRLGFVLLSAGHLDEALAHLRKAVKLDPTFTDARAHLGRALLMKGRLGEALDQFQMQVNLAPNDFEAEENMGSVLLNHGLAADALRFLAKAVEIDPSKPEGRYLFANALYREGHVREAIAQYDACIDLAPHRADACNDLAWILACDPNPGVRDGHEAVAMAIRADHLYRGRNPAVAGTLAAAYAETGQFAEAIKTSQRAIVIAEAVKNTELASHLKTRLARYKAGQPWRDESVKK